MIIHSLLKSGKYYQHTFQALFHEKQAQFVLLFLLNNSTIITLVALPFHRVWVCLVVFVWITQFDLFFIYQLHCLKPFFEFLIVDESNGAWFTLRTRIFYSWRIVSHWHTPEVVSNSMTFFDDLYQSAIIACRFTKSSKTTLLCSKFDSILLKIVSDYS